MLHADSALVRTTSRLKTALNMQMQPTSNAPQYALLQSTSTLTLKLMLQCKKQCITGLRAGHAQHTQTESAECAHNARRVRGPVWTVGRSMIAPVSTAVVQHALQARGCQHPVMHWATECAANVNQTSASQGITATTLIYIMDINYLQFCWNSRHAAPTCRLSACQYPCIARLQLHKAVAVQIQQHPQPLFCLQHLLLLVHRICSQPLLQTNPHLSLIHI